MLTTRIILHSDNLLTSVICITSTILHIKIAPQIIDATTQTIKKVIYTPPFFFAPNKSLCIINAIRIRFVSIFRRNFFKFSIFVSSDKKKAGHL